MNIKRKCTSAAGALSSTKNEERACFGVVSFFKLQKRFIHHLCAEWEIVFSATLFILPIVYFFKMSVADIYGLRGILAYVGHAATTSVIVFFTIRFFASRLDVIRPLPPFRVLRFLSWVTFLMIGNFALDLFDLCLSLTDETALRVFIFFGGVFFLLLFQIRFFWAFYAYAICEYDILSCVLLSLRLSYGRKRFIFCWVMILPLLLCGIPCDLEYFTAFFILYEMTLFNYLKNFAKGETSAYPQIE